MNPLFDGKTVLVTGAANGVGLATARAFASEGARVFVADIDAARGAQAAEAIVADGGSAIFLHADMADAASIQAMFDRILSGGGRLDAAVNNAAIDLEVGNERGSWRDETMERVWRVNVMGVFHCLQHELRHMELQRAGAIVNVSSLAGLTGVEGKPAYTAAKHAVVGLTRAAALQYGPAGVRVNAICPSGIKTEMYRIQGLDDDAMIAAHPLRRIADPGDIADAAIFLCSDRARNITGHPMVVDAGRMAC